MFSSRNGRVLYVSRPSLADVIAMNLKARKIVWRTRVRAGWLGTKKPRRARRR